MNEIVKYLLELQDDNHEELWLPQLLMLKFYGTPYSMETDISTVLSVTQSTTIIIIQ